MAEPPAGLPAVPDDGEPEEFGAPNPEMFDRFLRVQMGDIEVRRAEMEVRRAEVELRREDQTHSWDHAGQLLNAQLRDRGEQRRSNRHTLLIVLAFLAFLVLAVLAVVFYLLYLGKDELVEEIVKAILYVTLGGAGGYGASEHRRRKDLEKGPVEQA